MNHGAPRDTTAQAGVRDGDPRERGMLGGEGGKGDKCSGVPLGGGGQEGAQEAPGGRQSA